MSQLVSWEMEGQIAVIKMSNPPSNAINRKFLIEMNVCLYEIEQVKTVKAMVLMSTSKVVFAETEVERSRGMQKEFVTNMQLFTGAIEKIKGMPFPTIAIVSGFAIGEGFELALGCDYRVATKSARFGFLKGSSPTKPGEDSLITLIGKEKAKEVIMSGQIYGGIEAKRIGVVNQLIIAPPLLHEGTGVELICSQLGKFMKAGKWKANVW